MPSRSQAAYHSGSLSLMCIRIMLYPHSPAAFTSKETLPGPSRQRRICIDPPRIISLDLKLQAQIDRFSIHCHIGSPVFHSLLSHPAECGPSLIRPLKTVFFHKWRLRANTGSVLWDPTCKPFPAISNAASSIPRLLIVQRFQHFDAITSSRGISRFSSSVSNQNQPALP